MSRVTAPSHPAPFCTPLHTYKHACRKSYILTDTNTLAHTHNRGPLYYLTVHTCFCEVTLLRFLQQKSATSADQRAHEQTRRMACRCSRSLHPVHTRRQKVGSLFNLMLLAGIVLLCLLSWLHGLRMPVKCTGLCKSVITYLYLFRGNFRKFHKFMYCIEISNNIIIIL